MLIKAGVDGKATVFLFSDNQIKEESFVEDINMILNTGDVPNIFPADEKADVIEKMQTVARVEVSKNNHRSTRLFLDAHARSARRFLLTPYLHLEVCSQLQSLPTLFP